MNESPPTGDWHESVAAADSPAIPGYEVLGVLGRGGMGVVYHARHVGSGREVALKVMRDAAFAGPALKARFRLEAGAAARMRHPNLVRVDEVGEAAGHPFIAMEYVPGGSLDRYLAGRRPTAAESAAFVRTLADAVAHAHDRQIVHRDLKPANILLAGAGVDAPLAAARPVIADFGLAKRLDADSTAWTHDGAVLGTPGYMAPEQAAGRTNEIGPATDVHALGVILYELLVGKPAFAGDTRERLLRMVVHDDPTPPTRHRPDVPADLETVCLKCLEKEPARRYATARELADDLGRFLAGRPVAAVPLGDAERVRRAAARDGFTILGEIGRGPRSVVYRVRHESSARPLALKVFARGHATKEEWDARLTRCGELSAALAHPNVLAADRGGWWDGVPFVVTAFVPLGSLGSLLDGRPVPPVRAVRLVERVAGLIRYCHRQGVVHGNLKPGNVLLAADDTPQLIDHRPTGAFAFGPLPAADADPAGLGYLPPEFAADPSAEWHPTADVYGLGLLLYELLTGRPAFDGATAAEVLNRVRNQNPAPLGSVLPDASPLLDYLCRRCLLKNPWMRFSRVYDLARPLRRFLDEAGHGRGPSLPGGTSPG